MKSKGRQQNRSWDYNTTKSKTGQSALSRGKALPLQGRSIRKVGSAHYDRNSKLINSTLKKKNGCKNCSTRLPKPSIVFDSYFCVFFLTHFWFIFAPLFAQLQPKFLTWLNSWQKTVWQKSSRLNPQYCPFSSGSVMLRLFLLSIRKMKTKGGINCLHFENNLNQTWFIIFWSTCFPSFAITPYYVCQNQERCSIMPVY